MKVFNNSIITDFSTLLLVSVDEDTKEDTQSSFDSEIGSLELYYLSFSPCYFILLGNKKCVSKSSLSVCHC